MIGILYINSEFKKYISFIGFGIDWSMKENLINSQHILRVCETNFIFAIISIIVILAVTTDKEISKKINLTLHGLSLFLSI